MKIRALSCILCLAILMPIVSLAASSPETQKTSQVDGADVTQGSQADTAVTNSASSGSLMSFLKGLVKIFSDIWDSGNHRVNVAVQSSALPTGAATESTISTLNGKIPASPSQEHTTAVSPTSTRLSDGAAFYKPTTPSDTQPISAASLPIPTGAALDTSVDGIEALLGTSNTNTGNAASGVGATGDAAATAGSTGSLSAKLRLMSTQLDSILTELGQKTEPANTQLIGDGAGPLTVDGTVTANAGTNLNTSALALETGGNLASTVTNTSNTASGVGTTSDAAVTTNTTGSLSGKLRGLVAILADVWDSGNHWLKVSIQNSSIAVTGTFWQATQPVSVADGSSVTLGSKADAKSAATDTTSVTIMSVLKQISASVQSAASSLSGTLTIGTHPVTNAGTFAVQVTGLPSAAAEADAIANPTLTQIGVFMHGYNGTTWDRLVVDGSKFLKVNCATGCSGGASTPADAFANPTTAGLSMGFNMGWNGSTWDRLQVDGSKFLKVNIAGQSLGKVLVTPDSVALPANQSVNVSQINGVTPLMGNGVTGTGSPRMTIASDQTAFSVNAVQSGPWTVQPGNTANTTAWKVDGSAVTQPVSLASVPSHAVTNAGTFPVQATEADGANTTLGAKADAKSTATDTTSISIMAVLKQVSASVQAIATSIAGSLTIGTLPNEGQQTMANSISVAIASDQTFADACDKRAKTSIPFSISSATTTQLVAQSASNKLYVCAFHIVVGAANNVALVEDDTSACASPTAGMAGGTTAATGWNFAANGGLTLGNGQGTVMVTAATNRFVCLITSGTAQTSGSMSYVLAS